MCSTTRTKRRKLELKQYGNIYTRISNPTTAVLEERLASLENGAGAVAFASGLAAQFATFMTLLSPGDEVVASAHLYGGTVTQFTNTFTKLSVKVTLVGPLRYSKLGACHYPENQSAVRRSHRKPARQHSGLEGLAGLAKSKRIPLVVDATFATPYLCRPIDWGASIVVDSATKFIGGHGSSIGGVVVDAGTFDFSRFATIAAPSSSYHGLRFCDTFGHYGFLMKLRGETLRDTGACISPMNSFLLLQGVETLALRIRQACVQCACGSEVFAGA